MHSDLLITKGAQKCMFRLTKWVVINILLLQQTVLYDTQWLTGIFYHIVSHPTISPNKEKRSRIEPIPSWLPWDSIAGPRDGDQTSLCGK